MICRCGYQNEPEDFYCAQCGRKLGRNKGGKGWIIAIVAVLLVAALAVGAWFLFRDKLADPEPTETTDEFNEGVPEDPEGARPGEDDSEEEPYADGWDGDCYYLDGVALKGLQKIGDEYYCFSEEDGRKLTGWQQLGDAWHYFTAEGPAPGEGWYEDDNGWFYLEANGKHRTLSEEFQDKNRIFELDENGYLKSTVYKLLECQASKQPIGEFERDVLLLPGAVTGCKEFRFTVDRAGTLRWNSTGSGYDVWVCKDSIWGPVDGVDIQIDGTENKYILTFEEPQDISGIYIGIKDGVVNAMLTDLKAVK